MVKRFDGPSIAVILATLALFVAALFFKGFTHDLLLEAGVFLVSVKLVLAAYKASVAEEELRRRLDGIESGLRRIEATIVREGGGKVSGGNGIVSGKGSPVG
jgi:hypothetical protein